MPTTQFDAVVRPEGGKGNARATRRNGQVPAVIYGNNENPILIALDKNKLTKRLETSGFLTNLAEVVVNGKKHMVLPRDVQLDPVSDLPLHVDFLRVTDKTEIRVNVPIHAIGADKCPGVKKGGVLNMVSHEIELYALANAIPSSIEVNASQLDIGDAVHMGEITLPKGVRLVNPDEAEMTLITIAAPTVEKEAAPAEAAAAAPAAAGKAAPAAAGKAAPAAGKAAAPAAKPAAKK